MTKINENTKVTLTLGQFKKLVKESMEYSEADKKALMQEFLDVCKEYVDEMGAKINYRRTGILARASNATYEVYLDYSAIRKRFTKDEEKLALSIFNKYASKAIFLIEKIKEEYYPELNWRIEKTSMSSALIGKSLGISSSKFNLDEIFPEFELSSEDSMSESTKKASVKLNENTKVTLTIGQLKRLIENDHRWNPAMKKIVSEFQPKVHDIEGVSLTEFGTEDPVKLAEKLYSALAEKNGLTGTRYVPGGYSHAGFDYHRSNDGDFKLYFNDRPTFTFRHVVLNKRHTKWVPDGNPYDGVSPVDVWTTMADHCAITIKPGFKMADLKEVQNGMEAVSYFAGKFDVVQNAKYPFSTLKWLFQAKSSWAKEKLFDNYLNFISYEAGPFLTKKLLDLGTISGTDLAELTAQIVSLNGVSAALEPKHGHGQTPEEFKAARDSHRRELKQKLADKKNAAATQAKVDEFKKLIDDGITYEELMDRDDFPNIVTAVLTMSGKLRRRDKPSCCDYHEYYFGADEDDLELHRDQYFDDAGYGEAFNEVMDKKIEEFMTDDADTMVEYGSFEDGMLSALKYADNWDVLNPYDYVEDIDD